MKKTILSLLVFFLMLSLAGVLYAQPKGSITVGMSSIGPDVWPGNKTQYPACTMLVPVWEGLARTNADAKFEPSLAERWEKSSDGMSWTFYLRQGVQFHDGWGEVTAEDVKFSFAQAIAEDSKNAWSSYYKGAVSKVEIVDKYTAKFHMSKPDWSLIEYFGKSHLPTFSIVSKKHFETLGEEKASKHPVGTGPFKFVESKAGDYFKFEALDNHWRKVPSYRTLYYKQVPEMATRIAMLRTGQIDISMVDPSFVPEVKNDKNIKIMEASGRVFWLMFYGQYLPERKGYDPTVPWVTHIDEPHDFNHPETMSEWNQRALKVRQAMDHAIDKQEIMDYVLNGLAKKDAQFYFFPDQISYDKGWKTLAYDPDKAKKLLKEAGYKPKDIKIKIALAEYFASIPIMEAIGHQFEAFGFKVEYENFDTNSFFQKGASRDLSGYVWGASGSYYFSPITGIYVCSYSKAQYSFGVEIPELDQMIDNTLTEMDDAKRQERQREIGWYLYNGRLLPTMFYTYSPIALGPRIKDVKVWMGTWHGYQDPEYFTLKD